MRTRYVWFHEDSLIIRRVLICLSSGESLHHLYSTHEEMWTCFEDIKILSRIFAELSKDDSLWDSIDLKSNLSHLFS